MSTADAGEGNPTRIQSVSRAVRVLLAVAGSEQGLLAKEVSSQFEFSLPTSYHLLNTMVAEGILYKDEKRRFTVGAGAAVIAEAFNRRTAAPESHLRALEDLAYTTGETAYLSAWRRNEIVVLATIEGSHAVRVKGLTTGYSHNIHARASGKLLLAFCPDDVREQLLERLVLQKLTASTITDSVRLRQELELIRAADISYDRQEFYDGVDCVSAPIREGGTVVASLTVSCPAARFAERRERIVESLMRAAASVNSS